MSCDVNNLTPLDLRAGVRPLLHISATSVIKNADGVVQGVITESKSGRQAILAQRVIDCTGDADIAWLSGCPYTVLPPHGRMGTTQVFNVVGVEKEKFLTYATKENPKTYRDWSEGEDDEAVCKHKWCSYWWWCCSCHLVVVV